MSQRGATLASFAVSVLAASMAAAGTTIPANTGSNELKIDARLAREVPVGVNVEIDRSKVDDTDIIALCEPEASNPKALAIAVVFDCDDLSANQVQIVDPSTQPATTVSVIGTLEVEDPPVVVEAQGGVEQSVAAGGRLELDCLDGGAMIALDVVFDIDLADNGSAICPRRGRTTSLFGELSLTDPDTLAIESLLAERGKAKLGDAADLDATWQATP